MRDDVGIRDVVQLPFALGRGQGHPAVVETLHPCVARDVHAVRRQRPLQHQVGRGHAEGCGTGQHQVDVQVLEDALAPPVVACHEEWLEGRRAAGSGLRRQGEDHAARGEVAQRGPHVGRAFDDECRSGPPGGVRLRQARCGVPVLLEPRADHQSGAADPLTVPGHHARFAGIDRHHLGPDRRAALRDHLLRGLLQRRHGGLSGSDVVEQWSVTMDRLGLHHRHVARAVA